MKVIVIIPAAGLGTRMAPMPSAKDAKSKKPHPSKQFTDLAGTPILIHTLRKFAAVEAVNEIWIALRENEIEGFRERLATEAKDALQKKSRIGDRRRASPAIRRARAQCDLCRARRHRPRARRRASPGDRPRSFTKSSRPRKNTAPPSPDFPPSTP